jgi:hypothetical protein
MQNKSGAQRRKAGQEERVCVCMCERESEREREREREGEGEREREAMYANPPWCLRWKRGQDGHQQILHRDHYDEDP